jgi:catechol 2,3-dioxygenase-like lactoylglutathione lyase family enzyme
MKITMTSVLVDDQAKALEFYVGLLGFLKKVDMELPGGAGRWLTLVSPEAPDGVQLLLEPDQHPAARPFKSALFETASPRLLRVEDIQKEYGDWPGGEWPSGRSRRTRDRYHGGFRDARESRPDPSGGGGINRPASVTIVRTFVSQPPRSSPPGRTPALLRAGSPHPMRGPEASADARPGGRYRIVVVDAEGDGVTTASTAPCGKRL